MFNNGLLSDVKFVVRKSDGELESKQVIPAHKFVLSIGSPVFEAMFYGELAETRDSIELPDCEYESLFELFRYMYSDEVNLSGSNVMGVSYLAKKYMVPSLAEKCTEYLQENLDPSNVFSILPCAQKFEEKNLVDRCWRVIDNQTEAAVKSVEFTTIERSLLEAIVERDSLNIAEVELFKGVIEWARKTCEKRGLVANSQEKRRIMGERIVKAIRFPMMEKEELASVVLDSKILTLNEIINITKFFRSGQSSPVGFPVNQRSGHRLNLIRCKRFTSVKFGWTNAGKTSDIHILPDRDILFHGVYLFGSQDNAYSVSLTLVNESNGNLIASTKGAFLSVPHTSGKFYGFDVLLDEPVFLKKDGAYYLEGRIFGDHSWYGTQGDLTDRCCDAIVTLKDSCNAREGQFNEFIFSLSK